VTCGRRGVWPVIWAYVGPRLTVVVRCDPVVRGPDVAPMRPQCYGHEEGTARENDGARAWNLRPPARAIGEA
jgi:hypothetical protein